MVDMNGQIVNASFDDAISGTKAGLHGDFVSASRNSDYICFEIEFSRFAMSWVRFLIIDLHCERDITSLQLYTCFLRLHPEEHLV